MKKMIALLLVLLLALSGLTMNAAALDNRDPDDRFGEYAGFGEADKDDFGSNDNGYEDWNDDPVPWISFVHTNPNDGSEIYQVDPESGAVFRQQDVLYDGEQVNEDLDGATYDLETNTLYLDDFAHPDYILDVSAIGSLRIEADGNCALAKIDGGTSGADCSLTIGGTGVLNVNTLGKYEYSIAIFGEGAHSSLTFDTDVEVNLGRRKAAQLVLCDAESEDTAFVFDGEHNGEITAAPCLRDEPMSVEGITLDRTLQKDDLGELVTLQNAPAGIYTVDEFYTEEDGVRKDGVRFNKYIYVDSLGVYMRDPSYDSPAYYDDIPAYQKTGERLLNSKRVDQFYGVDVYEDADTHATYAMIREWSNQQQRNVNYLATYAPILDLEGVYRFEIVAEGDAATQMAAELTLCNGERINGVVFYDLQPIQPFMGYLLESDEEGVIYTAVEGSNWIDDEEIEGFWVRRLYYNEENDIYLNDHTFAGEDGWARFMTTDAFHAKYTFALDESDHHISIRNNGEISDVRAEVYQDEDENLFAGEWRWEDGGEYTRYYTFAPIDGAQINGVQQYLFTPVDNMTGDGLTEKRIYEELEGVHDYVLSSTQPEGFTYQGRVTQQAEAKEIDFVDIGNTWYVDGTTISAEYLYQIPFTAEINPDEPELLSQMYIYNEIWSNTEDGSTHEMLKPDALVPGVKYNYSVVLKARRGYKFVDGFRFVYGGTELTPDYTISTDGRTLTINGLIKDAVFNLDAPQLTGISNAYTGAKITWKADKAAPKFRVLLKNGSSWKTLATVTGNSYTYTSAKSGTKYTFSVCVIDAKGRVISGYDKTGVTKTFYAAPKISKCENTAKGTKITIGKVAGAAKYRYYVKNGSSWKKIADTTATSYVYTGVKGGKTYTYTVRAMDKKGNLISAYNTTGWKYTFVATPVLPTLKNTKNGVQITIKKSAGAAKYRIFRKTGSGGWKKLADTTKLTYLDKTAKRNVTYRYTIRCLDKNGKYVSAYNTSGRYIICRR